MAQYWLGKERSQDTKDKISLANKGRKRTEESKEKTRQSMLGKKWSIESKNGITGEKCHRWISDRSLIKRQTERNNPEYKQWRHDIWKRDNFKCRMANEKCSGKIEAHHILGWTTYPELRYEINNGITLCHAHHPRKRAEESRLSPFFQDLINNSI